MSSGVKSTIITAPSSAREIILNINAIAAVRLKPIYDTEVCGIYINKTSNTINLVVFSVSGGNISADYISAGEQFRVLYVD